jgi:hypothetical protein
VIINTHTFESAYRNLGGDFALYRIRVRNPFALGDTFCVLDTYYLESSRDLQLTFRSKKNRFEELSTLLKTKASTGNGNYADLLNLYLRVTTREFVYHSNDVREEIQSFDVFEASAPYRFENERYEYMRVNFSGIDVDYRNTKLELFVFSNSSEYNLNDIENEDYIARVTLFDINMPKESVKVDKFEILK